LVRRCGSNANGNVFAPVFPAQIVDVDATVGAGQYDLLGTVDGLDAVSAQQGAWRRTSGGRRSASSSLAADAISVSVELVRVASALLDNEI
jgi:hypothetical protein